jgi:hypothetical protein
VSESNINALEYARALFAAHAELERGTDFHEINSAAAKLREYNPRHPMLPALELRLRQAARIHLMLAKAKLRARVAKRLD